MTSGIDTVNQRIGSVPQYFFDNGVIEQVQDITRVWHCPEKQQGPLIKSDQPWEDVTYFSCNTWNVIAPRTVGLVRGPELGMKPHSLRVGDGAGGWTWQPAEFRFLHAPGSMLMPFGLAQMDNGEVALIGAVGDEKTPGDKQTACAAFSSDAGSTWTDWLLVPDAPGRPMSLAYLGGGKLSFYTNNRFFSSDYGRTWPEQVKIPPAAEEGSGWGGEGRPWWNAIPPETSPSLRWAIETSSTILPGRR